MASLVVLLQPALPPRLLKREASSTGASTVAAGIGPTRVRNTETPARRPLMDQRHRSHWLPPQAHPMLSLYASDLATSPPIQPLNDRDASKRACWLAKSLTAVDSLMKRLIVDSCLKNIFPLSKRRDQFCSTQAVLLPFLRVKMTSSEILFPIHPPLPVCPPIALSKERVMCSGASKPLLTALLPKSQVLLTLPAFYVPQSRMCLLSPQVLTTWFNGSISQASAGAPFVVTWRDAVTNRTVWLEAPLLPASRVPALTVRGPSPHLRSFDVTSFLQSARAALVTAPSFITDDSNVNLTAHQKILLRLHYRLGHVGFNDCHTFFGLSGCLWRSCTECCVSTHP